MMLMVLAGYVKYKSGTFAGSCKLQNSAATPVTDPPTPEKYLKVVLRKKGSISTNESDTDAFRNITFDADFQKLNEGANATAAATALIGKDIITFNVKIDKYPHSVRYEGDKTAKLEYEAPGQFKIGGITQTLWGGGNTQYMASAPTTTFLEQELTGSMLEGFYSKFAWDFKREQFKFPPQQRLAALTLMYKNSAVKAFYDKWKQEAGKKNYWTQGITPASTQKYWPKTGLNAEGEHIKAGPKHGEMVVVTLGFMSNENAALLGWNPNNKPVIQFFRDNFGKILLPNIEKDKDGKAVFKHVYFTYEGQQYQIYNLYDAQWACLANTFTVYDIYWNTASLVVCSLLMVIGTIFIMPTKCFNCIKYKPKKGVALVDTKSSME